VTTSRMYPPTLEHFRSYKLRNLKNLQKKKQKTFARLYVNELTAYV
jgi:hypothetical protein